MNSDILKLALDVDLKVIKCVTPNATEPVTVGAFAKTSNFPTTGFTGPKISREAPIYETSLRLVEFVSWEFCECFAQSGFTALVRLSTTPGFERQNCVDLEFTSVSMSRAVASRLPVVEGNYRFVRIYNASDQAMTYQLLFFGRK